MAGEVRIGGTTASVRLQGSDTIASDQAFTFPDAGAEIVVTPGTADIVTSKSIYAAGGIFRSDSSQAVKIGGESSNLDAIVLNNA